MPGSQTRDSSEAMRGAARKPCGDAFGWRYGRVAEATAVVSTIR
jgi:hypothetical protein